MRCILDKFAHIAAGVVMVTSQMILASCSKQGETRSDSEYIAVCSNGRFAGKPESETGIIAFKGIPGGEGTTINDLYTAPMCGIYPISDDIYESMHSGEAKDLDLMIGSTLDEVNYWICETGDKVSEK